jgi:predicted PurR-regulated permease PerM
MPHHGRQPEPQDATRVSRDAPESKLPEPNPEVRPSQVTLKTVFTICFGVLVVVGVVASVIHAIVAVALTAAALMIAVALNHLVHMLVRRRVRRPLAIIIVVLGAFAVIVALGFTLIPPAVSQGKQLVADAPGFIRAARGSTLFHRLDDRFQIADRVQEAERHLPEMLEGAASPVLAAVGGLLSAVAAVVTITFLVVFMLIFGPPLVQHLLAEARLERRHMYKDVLGKIYESIGGYLGGLLAICSINAVLTTTFLAADRVPFFLPLGILSGLSSMVPYAGPFVAGTMISLLALTTQGVWHGVAAAIYFVAYGQLEGNVLSPLIFRRTVHVNPLVVTLSILFLGEIAGVMGAIVAVPVVAALQIILREVLRIRREQLRLARAQEHEANRGDASVQGPAGR